MPQDYPLDPIDRLYDQLGEDTFRQIVAAFYRRVRHDTVIGPMYPANDWEGAEQRLAGFLIQRCGGPATYSQQRGHPRLRMRHAPFAIDQTARDRWVEHMSAALDETGMTDATKAILLPFFKQVATFMMNR